MKSWSLTLIIWLVFTIAASVGLPGQENQETLLSSRRQGDAAADRNLLSPSAETSPAGRLTFNNYELAWVGLTSLVGLTYGISDDLQVSCTGLLPLFHGQPMIVSGTMKGRLSHGKRHVFSIQGGVQFAEMNEFNYSLSHYFSLSLGTYFDFTPDRRGNLVVSLGLQGFLASVREIEYLDWDWRQKLDRRVTKFKLLPSLNVNYRVAKGVKLIAEVHLPGDHNDNGGLIYGLDLPNMIAYGIRFFGSKITVDLSLFRTLSLSEWGDNEGLLVLGFPFLTFSVRF